MIYLCPAASGAVRCSTGIHAQYVPKSGKLSTEDVQDRGPAPEGKAAPDGRGHGRPMLRAERWDAEGATVVTAFLPYYMLSHL
jgi:hypothetical protein